MEVGLCMLRIEKYTKGEQINCWVSVQTYSSRNLVYSLLMEHSMDLKFFFLSKAESWIIGAKTGTLKSFSDTCQMVLFHGVFQGKILPPKLSYPYRTFPRNGLIQSAPHFLPKTVLHI